MQRRDFLAGAGVAFGALTAGCTEALGEEGPRFEAEQARVPDSVADDAGYELAGIEDHVVERTFDVAGRSRTVEVVNWLANYEKRVGVEPAGDLRAALFAALSTPQVEALVETFNPVAEMSTEELADRIQQQYDQVREIEPEEESSITILGRETVQTRFDAEVELRDGFALDVYLHVSDPVESGEDFVIAVGGYPQQLPGEADNVLAMMEQVEHPVEQS